MIKNLNKKTPNIHKDSFIAENASIIGDVNIEEGASIWYNAVLRGDIENISIGRYSNVQDNSTVHTAKDMPVKLGDYTIVGHNAIIHGCTIGHNCLVGMGAIILDKAMIGDNCIIGAGSLVTEGKTIPPNSLVMGVPGKVVRQVTDQEIKSIRANAIEYNALYKKYL